MPNILSYIKKTRHMRQMTEEEHHHLMEEQQRTDGLNVIVGVDGSDHSDYALRWFLENIHRPKDHVIYVHIPPAVPTYEGISYKDLYLDHIPEPYEMKLQRWEKNINAVRQKILGILEHYPRIKDPDSYRFHVGEGNPGPQICKIAREENASLIIVASRGHGKIRRTVLGSVSDYVLHHAHCPVTICKKDPPDIVEADSSGCWRIPESVTKLIT